MDPTKSALAGRPDLPLLNGLGLSAEQFALLAKRGFIRREERGHKTVYRLCFREAGRQKSRYVRVQDAAALAAELRLLQMPATRHRKLIKLGRLARKKLRERRVTLSPLLEQRGFYMHGNQVRRRRTSIMT